LSSYSRGFDAWAEAVRHDKASKFADSRIEFGKAAALFFSDASFSFFKVAKALLEYSTVMDAFSLVQAGRISKSRMNYDEALETFAKASEILRATVHFGYAASYVSGCASLETAIEIDDPEESLQGLKNAIALFEQSKLALSFRDERHPIVGSANILIKYSISNALLREAQMLDAKGSSSDAETKRDNAREVAKEASVIADSQDFRKIRQDKFSIDYFPENDWVLASRGAFVTVFPEARGMWIGNVGRSTALIQKLGSEVIDRTLEAGDSIEHAVREVTKGKLRIYYRDIEGGYERDEGCLTVI
jgi:tetratricopeptide (TPR) repeat protein